MADTIDIPVVRKEDLDVAIEQIASIVKTNYAKLTALNNIINGLTDITYSGKVEGNTIREALDILSILVNESKINSENALTTSNIAKSKADNAMDATDYLTNGVTNIKYNAGRNTEIKAHTIKEAIDELGNRTNVASIQTYINEAVETLFASYTFSINNNDELILNSPDPTSTLSDYISRAITGYQFSIDNNDNLILKVPD